MDHLVGKVLATDADVGKNAEVGREEEEEEEGKKNSMPRTSIRILGGGCLVGLPHFFYVRYCSKQVGLPISS